jgi:hypothetical protein
MKIAGGAWAKLDPGWNEGDANFCRRATVAENKSALLMHRGVNHQSPYHGLLETVNARVWIAIPAEET